MILKIMIVVGYLAICSLLTSVWIDKVEKNLKTPMDWLGFAVVVLVSPFIFAYSFVRYALYDLLGLGDKNVGD